MPIITVVTIYTDDVIYEQFLGAPARGAGRLVDDRSVDGGGLLAVEPRRVEQHGARPDEGVAAVAPLAAGPARVAPPRLELGACPGHVEHQQPRRGQLQDVFQAQHHDWKLLLETFFTAHCNNTTIFYCIKTQITA